MGIANWCTGSRVCVYAMPTLILLCYAIYMYHRVHSSICLLCLTPVRSLLNYLRTMHYANGYLTRGICFIILLRGMLIRRYTKLGISVRFVRLSKYLLYTPGINHTCMALSSVQRVGYHMQCNGRCWGAQLALFTLHLICYPPIQVSIITTGLRIISYRNQVSDNAEYRSRDRIQETAVRAQRRQ